jgi:hypothetical protein
MLGVSNCLTRADGRTRKIDLQFFNVRGNVNRSDLIEFQFVNFAPAKKIADGAMVRPARVRVSDLRREEFNEADRGSLTGYHDHGRYTWLDRFGQLVVWLWDQFLRHVGI